jgi:hypothetical protein
MPERRISLEKQYMAVDVGYLSAVGAGAISFLSPCVLPLVPPYLCYMAGVSMDDFRGTASAEQGSPAARLALIGASAPFVYWLGSRILTPQETDRNRQGAPGSKRCAAGWRHLRSDIRPPSSNGRTLHFECGDRGSNP